jgi:hypothetical protein
MLCIVPSFSYAFNSKTTPNEVTAIPRDFFVVRIAFNQNKYKNQVNDFGTLPSL